MAETTTPSGADVDVLTVLNRAASFAARGRLRAPEYSARQCAKENREDQAAIAAVAALIARNAELEAERDALRKMWRQAEDDIKSRAADNKALQSRLSGLADHCRRVYDIVPQLPIDERSMEGATDALHAFCIMLGVNGIDIDSARTPAKGNDSCDSAT